MDQQKYLEALEAMLNRLMDEINGVRVNIDFLSANHAKIIEDHGKLMQKVSTLVLHQNQLVHSLNGIVANQKKLSTQFNGNGVKEG